MEQAKRVEWIDVAKGIGLLLVVIGHTMTTPIRDASTVCMGIYTGIYFFHMPFMFYLSGRTFGMARERYERQKTGAFIAKKGRQLMLPYVVYGLLVYLLFTIANSVGSLNRILTDAGYGKQSVLQWLSGAVRGDNLYAYHLWYVYALFLATIVSYLLIKTGINMKYPFILLGIVCLVIRIYVPTAGWGVLNLTMKCYLWFAVGIYMDFSKWVKKTWSIIWQILAAIYLLLIMCDYKGWNASAGTLAYEGVKWIADVGLLLLFVHIAMLLQGILKKVFAYTGKNSYGIYLFHQPFFASGGGLVLYKVLRLPLPIAVLVTFVMCYLFPLLAIRLLETRPGSYLKPYFLGTAREVKGKKRG